MRVGAGGPPELDANADLGVWVAALGEPGPTPPGYRASSTIATSGSARVLRLHLDREGPRPATASQAGCGVVLDGVLFDRRELTDRLGASGERPADDAGLLLRGYLRWGRHVFERIKGIFTAAIWDARNDTLLCARDRTGVYPLFYAEAGRSFLVSTSIDALLRFPGVASAIDPVALAGDLMFRRAGPEETHFSAVRRLAAGSLLEMRGAGTVRVSRYWNPAPPDTPGRWVREGERAQFDGLLEQAVSRSVELGRPCIYLSGGIDSVGVASVAADVCRRDGRPSPIALLMDHADIGIDETRIQREVATSLGLAHVRRSYRELTSHESALEDALEWTRALPRPLLYPGEMAYVSLSLDAKAHGCRVQLSGLGGDEWTSVHPLYGSELLRAGNLPGFARMIRASWRSYPWEAWPFFRASAWTFGLRALLAHAVRRNLRAHASDVLFARRRRAILAHAPGWLAPDPTVRRALEERIGRDVEDDIATLETTPGVYMALMRPMLETSFEHDFELSRRTGLRVMHPYWDADLVEFFYRTPASAHCIDGQTKGLVRRRLARRFPGLGFETQRKVVIPPTEQRLLTTQAPSAWAKQRGAPTLAALGVVDGARLREAMDASFARPDAVDYLDHVWPALNLEAWARAHAR